MKLSAKTHERLTAWAAKRMVVKPSELLRDDEGLYLSRWHILRARWFANIYIHQFHKSDDKRAMHNHPWFNISILLYGSYLEHTIDGVFRRNPGYIYFRTPWRYHRVELLKDEHGNEISVRTLFVTGPKISRWGFLCPQGWRPWRVFHTKNSDGKTVGCG